MNKSTERQRECERSIQSKRGAMFDVLLVLSNVGVTFTPQMQFVTVAQRGVAINIILKYHQFPFYLFEICFLAINSTK